MEHRQHAQPSSLHSVWMGYWPGLTCAMLRHVATGHSVNVVQHYSPHVGYNPLPYHSQSWTPLPYSLTWLQQACSQSHTLLPKPTHHLNVLCCLLLQHHFLTSGMLPWQLAGHLCCGSKATCVHQVTGSKSSMKSISYKHTQINGHTINSHPSIKHHPSLATCMHG